MKTKFLKLVGSELKIIRIENGYSQEELAVKTGIATSTISKYEMGEKDMNLAKIEQILRPYKIDLFIFFSRILAKTQKYNDVEKKE